MNDQNYFSGGRLFSRNPKNPQSPIMTGDVTIGPDLIEYLNEQYADRKDAVLEIAAWPKIDRNNKRFLSLKLTKPRPPQEGQRGYRQNYGQGNGYSQARNYAQQGNGYAQAKGNYPSRREVREQNEQRDMREFQKGDWDPQNDPLPWEE